MFLTLYHFTYTHFEEKNLSVTSPVIIISCVVTTYLYRDPVFSCKAKSSIKIFVFPFISAQPLHTFYISEEPHSAQKNPDSQKTFHTCSSTAAPCTLSRKQNAFGGKRELLRTGIMEGLVVTRKKTGCHNNISCTYRARPTTVPRPHSFPHFFLFLLLQHLLLL